MQLPVGFECQLPKHANLFCMFVETEDLGPRKSITDKISQDQRSKSVAYGLQSTQDNQYLDVNSSSQKRGSTASNANAFLPNVHHFKHNMSERMAQVSIIAHTSYTTIQSKLPLRKPTFCN